MAASHADQASGAAESTSPGSAEPDYAGCLQHLEANLQFSRNSVRSSVVGGRAGYFNFGLMFGSGQVGITSLTHAFFATCIFLNQFLRQCFPEGEWTSICVARSVQTRIHSDSGNLAGSCNFSVSMGGFSGGHLWLEGDGSVPLQDSSGKTRYGHTVCTRHSPFKFPADVPHATMPWSGGDRWSVTAYSVPGAGVLSEACHSELLRLGFPLPGSQACVSDPEQLPSASDLGVLPSPPPLPLKPVGFFLDICSGAGAPLSSELINRGISCYPVDIIRDGPAGDILDDAVYDRLLRIASSGLVSFAHASPVCSDFSRLKKDGDGGPRPIRTADFPEGRPDLTADEQQRLDRSKLLLVRCVSILDCVFFAGGQVSLEQPRNALSWLTMEVQEFLKRISADLVVIPACSVGMSVHKHWLFASSWRPLQQLASRCDHPYSAHADVRGAKDSTGDWASRKTAEFPPMLAARFAVLIEPVFSPGPDTKLLSCEEALGMLPCKPHDALPRANQDGGGIFSLPDWSSPPPGQGDHLRTLRHLWTEWLAAHHIPIRLRQHVQQESEDAVFSEAEVAELRELTSAWFAQQGVASVSWEIPEFQPYCLSALQAIAAVVSDRDTALWPALLRGVPTGINGDIPRSNVFVPVQAAESACTEELTICQQNWKQATEQPELLAQLVQKEVQEGWVFSVPDLDTARARWGNRVAIGKCNIIGGNELGGQWRKPRLIVDTTVSGTNPSVTIPEKYSLPGVQDVINATPLRGSGTELAGFSLDIRAAHKTVRIHPDDQGLLGFQADNQLWFYRVAPFGGSFSAHWFQRISAFMVRTFHLLLWVQHALWAYVDDFFLVQPSSVIELGASLLLCFCAVFGVPISYAKLQLGSMVRWIGWQFNLRAQVFSVPQEKLHKLLALCVQALEHKHTCRKDLEALIGFLHWLLQVSPLLRPWLSCLYADLARPLGTSYSVSPGIWQAITDSLSSSLHFTSSPPGSGLPIGGKLLSAKHVELHRKSDLRMVQASGKRLWLRVADPRTEKRKLSAVSAEFIKFWMRWAICTPRLRALRSPPVASPASIAADAMASGSTVGIGGCASLSSAGPLLWFSEVFQVQDFVDLGLRMAPQSQRDITCYETLAQHALLFLVAAHLPSGRLQLQLPTLCDNSGSEASVNKLFSTVYPICMFLQRIAAFSALSGLSLEVAHVPGVCNEDADMLSRWDGVSPLPSKWLLQNRVRLPLQRLWYFRSDVKLWAGGHTAFVAAST